MVVERVGMRHALGWPPLPAAARIRYEERMLPSLCSTCFPFLASHSQMTMTRQPRARSASSLLRSRATFRENFCVQYATRDLGIWANRHPMCWCQKQPWTNTADRNLGKTRSGQPGRSLRCSRKRKPIRWAMRRTASSGAVSRPRIPAISSLRRLRSTISATHCLQAGTPRKSRAMGEPRSKT